MAFVFDAHSYVTKSMVRLKMNVMSENMNVISRVSARPGAYNANHIRMADGP